MIFLLVFNMLRCVRLLIRFSTMPRGTQPLRLRGKMTVAGFTGIMMQLENTGGHFTAVHTAKYSHRCYLLQLTLWSKNWYLWLTLFSWLQHKYLCHLKWFLVSGVLTNLLSLTVNSILRQIKWNVGAWVTLGLLKFLVTYLLIEIKLDFTLAYNYVSRYSGLGWRQGHLRCWNYIVICGFIKYVRININEQYNKLPNLTHFLV